MNFIRLKKPSETFYGRAIYLYEQSFPVTARRDVDEQRRIMSCDDYHFDVVAEDDVLYGIVLYWETKDFIYCEHLRVAESAEGKLREGDLLSYLKSKNKLIYIEGETDEQIKTYKDYGFYLNKFNHSRVKYRRENSRAACSLLTYNRAATEEEYKKFNDFLTGRVQIQFKTPSEIVIRKLRADDDFFTVADMIYYSDNYIYPYLFNGVEEGRKVLVQMIAGKTIYNFNNIYVALNGGEITGAVVATKNPEFTFEEYKNCFSRINAAFSDRQLDVWNDYYALMEAEPDAVYIANICVASAYRDCGIGKKLLEAVFKTGDNFFLECVKANKNALNLYLKVGFEIKYEYPGFTKVPCYKLEKRGKN